MKPTQGPSQQTRLGFWVVGLLGVFAWAPATYPGYWQGLEGFVPIFNATQNALLASIATAPDFWRGSGGDTFLLARPLLLFGFTPTVAVRISFILLFVLGGFGIYSWLQQRLGDRAAGLAGLSYILLPPVLATAYIRGSLSDMAILGLLPMVLAGISSYATSRSLSAAFVTVAAIAWMWRSQAGLALLATLVLLSYAWFVERHGWSLLLVAVSALAAAVSLWPVWDVHPASPVIFGEHFVSFYQWFGTKWQVLPSVPGWQDGYPFQLGLIALLLSLLSFWYWRRYAGEIRATQPKLANLLGFGFGGIAIICLLSLSISAPFWQWTRAEQLLTYPWQVTLLAMPFLALTAGALPTLNREFATPFLWATLITLVILGSYSYLTTDFTLFPAPERPVATIGPQQNLVILSSDLVKQGNPPAAELSIAWQLLRPLPFDYNIFFQAQSGDPASPLVVAQLDGPPLPDGPTVTTWRPGEILTATYQLDLSEVDETELRYVFGFYDWRDGSRLPVDGGVDDKLVFYAP